MKFKVGREVRLPIHGKHHLFRRPIHVIGALLPSNLALAVQHIPVVRILAVRDPPLNGLVPDGALVVVMLVGRVLVDRRPLQTVGGNAKYGFLFRPPAHITRIVAHEEFAFLLALIVIQRQRDVVRPELSKTIFVAW